MRQSALTAAIPIKKRVDAHYRRKQPAFQIERLIGAVDLITNLLPLKLFINKLSITALFVTYKNPST